MLREKLLDALHYTSTKRLGRLPEHVSRLLLFLPHIRQCALSAIAHMYELKNDKGMPLLELLQEMLEARRPTNGHAMKNWRVNKSSFQLTNHNTSVYTDDHKLQEGDHNNTYQSNDDQDHLQHQHPTAPASQPATPPMDMPTQKSRYAGHNSNIHSSVTSSGVFHGTNGHLHSSMGIPQPRSSIMAAAAATPSMPQPRAPAPHSHYSVRATSAALVSVTESFSQQMAGVPASSSSLRGYQPAHSPIRCTPTRHSTMSS